MNSKNIKLFAILLMLSFSVFAQEAPPPAENLKHAFPAVKKFSPYAGRNYPTRVFWVILICIRRTRWMLVHLARGWFQRMHTGLQEVKS